MFDFKIPKTPSMNAYHVHQMVEKLFKGNSERNLFCDYGDHIKVRSTKSEIDGYKGEAVKSLAIDEVGFIELRSSCFVSVGGKKYFLKQGDWRSRHEWLNKKADQNGFSVLNVTCQSKPMKILKPKAEFTLDCTDFSGCIKVLDEEKFQKVLRNGIGSKGRAFGFGMLVL